MHPRSGGVWGACGAARVRGWGGVGGSWRGGTYVKMEPFWSFLASFPPLLANNLANFWLNLANF